MNYPVIKSHLSGSWYAADPVELRREIEACVINNPVKVDREVNCVILPHAGYAYSLYRDSSRRFAYSVYVGAHGKTG